MASLAHIEHECLGHMDGTILIDHQRLNKVRPRLSHVRLRGYDSLTSDYLIAMRGTNFSHQGWFSIGMAFRIGALFLRALYGGLWL
jgi:hypothetical protein